MAELYFKKSSMHGYIYLQVWKKNQPPQKDELLCNLGSPEKAYKNSVRLKELELETEKLRKALTELSKGKHDSLTEKYNITRKPGF